MKNTILSSVLLTLLLALAPSAAGQEDPAQAEAPPPWDDETKHAFALLPVQDEGRIKPLDTFAQFRMLAINGKRSLTLENGEKLDHMDWFLNCLFYPEVTHDYKHFIVDNTEALDAIGVEDHGGMRDRFSFNELIVGSEQLFTKRQEYIQIPAKNRSPVEQEIIDLSERMFLYNQIARFFDFAYQRFTVSGDTIVATAFPEEDGVPTSVALDRVLEVLAELRSRNLTDRDVIDKEVEALGTLQGQLDRSTSLSEGLPLFPPAAADESEYHTPFTMVDAIFSLNMAERERLPLLGSLEKLPDLLDDREALKQEVTSLQEGLAAAATERGEYSKIPLEVHYYEWQYLYISQVFYVLSFILVALAWLIPSKTWMYLLTNVTVVIPTLLLIVAITLRCIIRERPPVSTLYETILFITAVAAVTGLAIEWMNRQRIALAVTSLLGCMGLFLAYRYEVKEGVDTMPSLIAVLDTNFWLATHVTVVTAGYAAGLLAAAIAHVFILGRLFGYRKDDRRFYRGVSRMTYGVLCFCLLFSTVGTILGGIWANDSWGRFWGWDPKENGALMICLWALVVLHARMGRYIADLGIAMGTIILGMIVAFSWWGVNNLGVGLHSYGFTSGLWLWLGLFWGSQVFVILLGVVTHYLDRYRALKQQGESSPTPA